MAKKEWFMPVRYPVPSDLEYYLEEQAAEGYFLKPIGQQGLFYYEFEEGKSAKCKYMVDVTALPKAMYMETLLNRGWEYMGNSANCHIWKQKYEETRPEDMSDSVCKRKHCRNGAILFGVSCLIILAVIIALIWGFTTEIKMNAEVVHYVYIVEAILNAFLFIIFAVIFRKLYNGISNY